MSDDPAMPLAEDPRRRLRRLLEESEEEPSGEGGSPSEERESSLDTVVLSGAKAEGDEGLAGQDVVPTRPMLSEEDTAPLRVRPSPPPPQLFGDSARPQEPGATPTVPGESSRSPSISGQRSANLPERVNEVDIEATRVSPAAYTPPRSPGKPPSSNVPKPRSGLRSMPPSPPIVTRWPLSLAFIPG